MQGSDGDNTAAPESRMSAAMYQRCISSGSTGLCRPVRSVSVCAGITPARPLRFDRFRHRPIRTDTPVVQIWEQEAGSSNLPTPTKRRKGFSGPTRSTIQPSGNLGTSCVNGELRRGRCLGSARGWRAGSARWSKVAGALSNDHNSPLRVGDRAGDRPHSQPCR